MEVVEKIDGELQGKYPILQQQQSQNDSSAPSSGVLTSPGRQSQQQQQQQQQKTKRKHRRGKPKAKNANKPYKKTNWNFQVPRFNYNNKGNAGGGGGGVGNGGVNGGNNNRNTSRAKLARSRSLVPYNTNKFLMEEHMADVPSALLTPSGRTRDSSFSVDSEDNYFFSLPEDEEEFLTKEFANVYEKARVERLENLTKQQLIEECLQIEDRYSTDQGTQHEQQLTVQRISSEFLAKIRMLEEKVKELSRENYNLRCQLMRSAALAAAASPPSAAAPTGAACEPIPIDSSSEDSESDSSSSSTSTSSSSSGAVVIQDQGSGGGGSADGNDDCNLSKPIHRRHSCSSRSSLSEYNAYIENNYVGNDVVGIDEEDDNDACRAESEIIGAGDGSVDSENQNLLESRMEDDSNASTGEVLNQYVATAQQQKKIEMMDSAVLEDKIMVVTSTPMLAASNTTTVNNTDTVNKSALTGPSGYK